MTAPRPRLVLASRSPRRRELLETLGYEVEVRSVAVDERVKARESPEDHVRRLAVAKGEAADRSSTEMIVSADTVVVHGDEIIGKPEDDAHARRILARLAANTHRVLTGFRVQRGERAIVGVVESRVTFRALSARAIGAYVATGEPHDKAGAYGVQGRGGALVERVEGSYTNVVGLPLAEVVEAIESLSPEGEGPP